MLIDMLHSMAASWRAALQPLCMAQLCMNNSVVVCASWAQNTVPARVGVLPGSKHTHSTNPLGYLTTRAHTHTHYTHTPQVVRTDQNLDTWRPRVHGTQLKALLNCRLPEAPEEFAAVEKAMQTMKFILRVR